MRKSAQAWGIIGKEGWLYGICFKSKQLAEQQVAIFSRIPEQSMGPFEIVHLVEARKIKNKKRVIERLLSRNDKKHMAGLKKAIKGLKVSNPVKSILLKIAFEVNAAWIEQVSCLLSAGMSDPTGKKKS